MDAKEAQGKLVKEIAKLFWCPAVVMVAWGAFCNMVGMTQWAFGYWEFFMLYVAVQVLVTVSDNDNRDTH